MTIEREAAKPKRPRDLEFEDAPRQESIRGLSPRTIKRNPSSDQKRVRREMQRKTASESVPETDLSRLLVEAASDNPFDSESGYHDRDETSTGPQSLQDKPCESCGKPLGPEVFLGNVCGKCTRKRHKEVTGSKTASKCETCGNSNFTEGGSCTRCGRSKTASKTATLPLPTDVPTPDRKPELGDHKCQGCDYSGAPVLSQAGAYSCRNCGSYALNKVKKQKTAEKTTRATCPECGVGLIWGDCPNCGYQAPAAKKKTAANPWDKPGHFCSKHAPSYTRVAEPTSDSPCETCGGVGWKGEGGGKTAGAAGTYAGPSPTGGFHHWMGTDSEKEDQCISCGVVAPDHGEGVMSDHSPLPLRCPGPDGAYNAHHYTDAPDGKLDCAYCTHQVHDNSDPERDLGECLSPERGPIPASHPNAKKHPEYAEDGGDNAYGRAQDNSELRNHLGSKTAEWDMRDDAPDVPSVKCFMCKNGYDDKDDTHPSATACPGCGVKRGPVGPGPKMATHFDTQADKLNPGDQIRTPTGQTVKVLRMRNHETSGGHVYMDTDQGTSVVRRKSPVSIVPFNSQQQELPGYGIPGGNTNKLPMDTGNVGPSKQTPSGSNEADPKSKGTCPVCGARGTMARKGQSYVCSKCGYRENIGAAGPGKGFDFTDAPQRLMRSSSLDQKSAIARRAQEVLETTEEIQ